MQILKKNYLQVYVTGGVEDLLAVGRIRGKKETERTHLRRKLPYLRNALNLTTDFNSLRNLSKLILERDPSFEYNLLSIWIP